MFKFGHLRTG